VDSKFVSGPKPIDDRGQKRKVMRNSGDTLTGSGCAAPVFTGNVKDDN